MLCVMESDGPVGCREMIGYTTSFNGFAYDLT